MKINIILLSWVLLVALSSCHSQNGHLGASKSIQESKDRGVFICEYTVNDNPYQINDCIQITVESAWLEKRWRYAKKPEQTNMDYISGFQLRINSKKEDLKGVDFEWTIGIDTKQCMRASSYSTLIGDFKTEPSDTITYEVQKGRDLMGRVLQENIIGKFVIYKK